jgi:uncharacterized repeat protein (TIGR03803 family)
MRRLKSLVVLASLALVFGLAGVSAAQTFTTLHAFAGGSDGANPYCFMVFDKSGNLYGTTDSGGIFAFGTIFELSPSEAGGWEESVLHSFNGTDGGTPNDGLVFDAAGNLYGTAGTVFELTPSGSGVWTLTVIFDLSRTAGANPVGGVIFDGPTRRLYGTTPYGDGSGAVFALAPGTSGMWSEIVLHNAVGPARAGLVADKAGNLYGTTTSGGTGNNGTIYELSHTPGGGWAYRVLYNFPGGSDGADINAGLVLDASGNLYGTSTFGGASNNGTVFELKRTTGGNWKEKVLYNFGGGEDGTLPVGGVVFDTAGNLYGTTQFGGGQGTCHNGSELDYCGTVFKLSPPSSGSGSWSESMLYRFTGADDGGNPGNNLVLDSAGNVYGTATVGGQYGFGTAFEVEP